MKPLECISAVGILAVVVAVSAGAVLAADYAIDWYTADGGGAGPADASSGGAYTLSGTVGQPDAQSELMEGGAYTLTGGFWAVALPACGSFAPPDFDHDCDVDADDLAVFQSGFSGPSVWAAVAYRVCDFDQDGDVDVDDFGTFQRCYSGAGVPADTRCAD